jgi:hypothetical protein
MRIETIVARPGSIGLLKRNLKTGGLVMLVSGGKGVTGKPRRPAGRTDPMGGLDGVTLIVREMVSWQMRMGFSCK